MTPEQKEAKKARLKDISRKLATRKGKRGFGGNVLAIEEEVKKLKKELGE